MNRVVDQRITATYVAVLTCFSNIGWRCTNTIVGMAVDWLSSYDCKFDGIPYNISSTWNNPDLRSTCKDNGGNFVTVFDGYYLETIILVVLGFIYWALVSFKLIPILEKKPKESWMVQKL